MSSKPRPLQILGDYLLNLLDRYVQRVGWNELETRAREVISWTPYASHYVDAMRGQGNRYR